MDGEIDRQLNSSAVFTTFVYAVGCLSPVKVMEHPATVNKLKKIEWGNYFVCLRFIYFNGCWWWGGLQNSHTLTSVTREGVHEMAVLPALALISCPDSEPPLDHLPVFYVVALLLFLKVDMKR